MFRGSVVFDESGFLSEEMMNVYSAFAVVNKNLKTGKDSSGKSIDPIRQRCFPISMPYQKIYISSASSTDTKFYKLYREFAKKQIMGDPDYCVLHMDCELAFEPTLHGEIIEPLLSRSTVEAEMRTNPEKARREYYCMFTTEAGADAIVKRGVITRNEEVRKPLLYNDTGDKKFIIAYDPARLRDNSIVLVGEVYDSELPDGNFEKKMRLVNCINLLDPNKKIKSPMQTPDQIKYIKQLIVDYNAGADGYDNILGVYIDAGAGGGAPVITDEFMKDWTDKTGITHRGIIDKDYSAEYVKRFPNAVNKLHIMNPNPYKPIMFEAMIEMINQDKISFTAQYDNKDYLTLFETDEKKFNEAKERISRGLKSQKLNDEEFERKLNEELNKIQSVKTKSVKLNQKEKHALVNIDALKEELVNMVRKKKENGKDGFDLAPEKSNILNDDRAYTMAMAGYALMQERRKNFIRKPKVDTSDLLDLFRVQKGKRFSSI